MRNLFITTFLLLSLLLVTASYSADFDKGQTFANNGDFATAFKEFKPIADQGSVYAQYYLSQIYIYGLGTQQDFKEAARYLGLAAKQGFVYAQYDLGKLYYYGDGVDQDYLYAFMWWEIANINGLEKALKTKEMFYEDKISSKIKKAHDLAETCLIKNYKSC